MASNNGGPWGGGGGNRGGSGGGNGGDDDRTPGRGQRPGGQGQQGQIPEIDEIVRKGQEQLRVLMGGRGGGSNGRGPGGGGLPGGGLNRTTVLIGVLVLAALWLYASLYRVDTSEQSVELMFGLVTLRSNIR